MNDETKAVGNDHSEAINELVAALAKAQGAFEPISKSRVNPRFGHAYATLDDIISATRKALSANGLAVMQVTPSEGTTLYLETLLAHSSGQWLSTSLPIMVGNITSQAGREVLSQAQAFGSALTYARRYALATLLNVAAEEDDDAETSGGMGKALLQRKAEATAPQDARSAPKTPDVGKEAAQGEKGAVTRGNCPVHGVLFIHRTGIVSKGPKAGQPYDFWSCPEKLPSGAYCSEKPQPPAQTFERLWDELQPASGDLGKSESPLGERATPQQINALYALAHKLGKSQEDIIKELGKAPEELTKSEAGQTIQVWGKPPP